MNSSFCSDRELTMSRNLQPQRWVDNYGDALYHHALKLLRDPLKAEEAVQEAMLAGLQSMNGFDGRSTEKTWLFSILRFKVMDEFRRMSKDRARHQSNAEDEETEGLALEQQLANDFDQSGRWRHAPSDWGDPEDVLASEQLRDLLDRCIARLPRRHADAFVLKTIAGEDTETVCQVLDVTPTNLWQMLYRARMGLRRCIEAEWGKKDDALDRKLPRNSNAGQPNAGSPA